MECASPSSMASAYASAIDVVSVVNITMNAVARRKTEDEYV